MVNLLGTRALPLQSTDAVVIGAGPSGLMVSSGLAGLTPYYKGQPFFSQDIQEIYKKTVSSSQDISDVHHPSDQTPLSQIFERLAVKDIRFWNEDSMVVRHVVLTSGDIGGCWNELNPDMKCLSRANWMALPGLDWAAFKQAKTPFDKRPSMGEVAEYYREYAKTLGLSDNIHTHTVVEKIEQVDGLWQVHAREHGKEVVYESKIVILACGKFTIPRCLGIEGEDLDFVTHRMPSEIQKSTRLMVIGGGITGADCVLMALRVGCTVYHLFRDTNGLGRFDQRYTEYGGYADLLDKMRKVKKDPRYKPMPGGILTRIEEGGRSTVTYEGKEKLIQVAKVYILIGSQEDLSFLDEKYLKNIKRKTDPYTFKVGEGLYAVGSLGDVDFVKNSIAGCFAAAHEIRREIGSEQNEADKPGLMERCILL
jgi:thioredoxin reductase